MLKSSYQTLAEGGVRRPTIQLTPVKVDEAQPWKQVTVPAFELIAYRQDPRHTCLHLTGRRTLEVRESTEEIDRLVRAAAS